MVVGTLIVGRDYAARERDGENVPRNVTDEETRTNDKERETVGERRSERAGDRQEGVQNGGPPRCRGR